MLIHLFLLYRGGRGGGYKELDEQELEETKRRRREAEQVKYSFTEAFSVFVRFFFCLVYRLTLCHKNFRMMVKCMMSLAI